VAEEWPMCPPPPFRGCVRIDVCRGRGAGRRHCRGGGSDPHSTENFFGPMEPLAADAVRKSTIDATLRLLASPDPRDKAVSTLLQVARVDPAAVASVVADGHWAGALVDVLRAHAVSGRAGLARSVVALMLALLFSRIELRVAFGEAGVADLARRMLLRPGAAGADQEAALLLLMGIARGDGECVTAVALGAAPLVRLLPVHPIALVVLRRACGALTASIARALTREGAVAPLVAMSQVGGDTAACASAILCQLAKRCGDASLAPPAGRARAYVLALSAGSAKERERAAIAIFPMSAPRGESAVALVRAGCVGPLAELLFRGGASAQVQAAMSLLAVSWASAEGSKAVAQTIGSRKPQHGAGSALASVILIAMSPVGQAELGCADFGALFGEEFACHMGAPDGDAESAVDGLHAILAFLVYLQRCLCTQKVAVVGSRAAPAAGGVWEAVVSGVATGASRLGAAAMESRGAEAVQLLRTGTPAERAAALGLFDTLAHIEGEAVQKQLQLACAPLLALVRDGGPGGGADPRAAHTLASLLQRDPAGTLATDVVEAGCVDSLVRALYDQVVGVHSLAQEWALEAMVGLAGRGGHRAARTAVNVADRLGGAKGLGAARELAALAAEGLRVAGRARPREVERWHPVESGGAHESEARRCLRAAREAAATLACDAAEARRARPAERARCSTWTPAPRSSPPARRGVDTARDQEARIRMAREHSRQLALDEEARVGVEVQRWELRRLGDDIAHGRG